MMSLTSTNEELFIKASIDGIMEPKVFPIDLIDLNKAMQSLSKIVCSNACQATIHVKIF